MAGETDFGSLSEGEYSQSNLNLLRKFYCNQKADIDNVGFRIDDEGVRSALVKGSGLLLTLESWNTN